MSGKGRERRPKSNPNERSRRAAAGPLRAHFDRCCVKDVSLLSRAVENLLDRSRDAEGKQRRVVGTREPKGDLIERFSASPRLRLPLKYCAVPRE